MFALLTFLSAVSAAAVIIKRKRQNELEKQLSAHKMKRQATDIKDFLVATLDEAGDKLAQREEKYLIKEAQFIAVKSVNPERARRATTTGRLASDAQRKAEATKLAREESQARMAAIISKYQK